MIETRRPTSCPATEAAVVALMVLTGVMLLALFTRTPPHPPLAVAPFALGPFLGASLAIGAAALCLAGRAPRAARALALLFAATALVSFGPQKYLDPAFPGIWPTVITAQVVILAILVSSARSLRRARTAEVDGARVAG